MRRVIVSNAMSLDGFVSGPNGELDWFVHEGFLKGTAADLRRVLQLLAHGHG